MELRDRRIAVLYREGRTGEEIAQAFGITRQRVSQILVRDGLDRRYGGAHVRSQRKHAALEPVYERLDALMREKGIGLSTAARELGISESETVFFEPSTTREERAVIRFWRRVDQSGGPDACWPWTGYRLPNGYGYVRSGIYAHRFVFLSMMGPLPIGKGCVLHTCDNPPCCNPAHLYAGTPADNMRDRDLRGHHRSGMKGRRHTAETLKLMREPKSWRKDPSRVAAWRKALCEGQQRRQATIRARGFFVQCPA